MLKKIKSGLGWWHEGWEHRVWMSRPPAWWPALPCAGHNWAHSHSGHALGTAGVREGSPASWWREKCEKQPLRDRGSRRSSCRSRDFSAAPMKVSWGKYSVQPVGRTIAEQIPPLHPWRAPTGIFLSQKAADSGRVLCWSKGEVWGGRSSKEELGPDLKVLSKLLRGARNVGAEESNEEGKVCSFGLFSHSVTLVYLVIN